jgi:phage-related protein
MATLTSLGFSIFSRYDGSGVDRARRDLNDLNNTLERNTGGLNNFTGRLGALATAAVSLGPALGPIAAAASAVAGGLAAATTSAGAAAGIWGIAAKAAIGMTDGAVKASDKLREQKAILATLTPGTQAYADQLKKVQQAQGELNAAMAQLGPTQQQYVKNIENLKTSWEGFVKQTSPATLGPVNTIIQTISGNLSKLVPVVNAVGVVAQKVADSFAGWANNGGLDRFISIVQTDGVPALSKFVTIAQNLLKVLGDGFRAFLPTGQQVLDILVKWSGELAKWGDGGGFQRFLQYVQQNGPAVRDFFVALGGALANVGQAIKDMGPFALTLTGTLLKLIAALPPSVIQAIAYAFLAWRSAVLLLNVALLLMEANPIVLAITAIIAVIVLIATKTTWFQTIWTTVWGAVKTVAEAVWNFLKDNWQILLAVITGGVSSLVTFVVQNWSDIWNTVKSVALAVWSALQAAWSAFITGLQTIWSAVSGALSAAWSAVWSAISAAAQAIWSALGAAWSAFINGLATIWSSVSSALSAAWSAIWNAISSAAQAIWSALQAAWQAFLSAVQSAWSSVSAALSAAWSAVWSAIQSAAQAIWSALQAAWQAFLSAVQSIWSTVSAALSAAWQAVWSAMQAAASAIWSAIQAAWQAFGSAIQSIWSTVSSALSAAWSATWNAIQSAGQAVWSAIQTAWSTSVNALKSTWDTVGNAIKTAWDGIWNGIKSTAQTIWNDIVGAVKTGVKAVVAPINLLLDGWNAVVGAVGLGDLKVPTISVNFAVGGVVGDGAGAVTAHFARGGVIPGYAPGKDTVHAMLSKGEGVLVPEAVRGLGPNFVHWANHHYSHGRGGKSVSYPGYAKGGIVGHYQGGGVVDAINGGVGQGGVSVPGATPNPVIPPGSSGAGTVNPTDGTGVQVQGGGGNTVSGVPGGITNVTGWVLGLIGEAVIHTFFDPLINAVMGAGQGPVPQMAHAVVKKGIDGMVAMFIKKDADAKPKIGGTIPAGQQLAIIDAALAAAGVPPPGDKATWEVGLNTLITRESGWNSGAVNNTDINAQNGVPSQGLAQVIPPTFAAYHVPGYDNILDPVSNVAAAIRYIVATYGDITNVQQANANLPPKGYRLGTPGARKGWHLVGEAGPEWVQFRGGERVEPNGSTPGGDHISVNFNENAFVFTIGAGASVEEFKQAAQSDLVPAIRMAVEAGVGKRRR